jgi:hypothetical protein
MTVADLRRALDTAVAELPADEIPDAIGLCAAAQARLTARLVARNRDAESANLFPSLVNAKEMAAILGVPQNWVRDRQRAEQIPCHHLGYYVRFAPAEVLEAVRKLPRLHNAQSRSAKITKQIKGGKRQESTEYPKSSGAAATETAPEARCG